MPTRNRQRFLRRALRHFLNQTYPNKELIVVDDGDVSAESLCRGLPAVRHIRLLHPTPTGTKLNLGIQAALGDILQKWDDDDYYGPEFLAGSVPRLAAPARARTLVVRCCFVVLLRGEPALRDSGHGWTPGGSFCFHRDLWRRKPFREAWRSEDHWFLRDHLPRVIRVCRQQDYMVVRHGRNTWNAMTTGGTDAYFRACPPYARDLSQVVDKQSFEFYRRLAMDCS